MSSEELKGVAFVERDTKKVAVNSFRNTYHFNLKLLKTCF